MAARAKLQKKEPEPIKKPIEYKVFMCLKCGVKLIKENPPLVCGNCASKKTYVICNEYTVPSQYEE